MRNTSLPPADSLLRGLPREGEPAVVHALRLALGRNDDFRVDAKRRREGAGASVLEAPGQGVSPTTDLWPTAIRATTAPQLAGGVVRGKATVIVGPSASGWWRHDATARKKRPRDTATTGQVLVGSKIACTEDIHDNLGLLRQWRPDPSLCVGIVVVGRRSRTMVAVVYLDDAVCPRRESLPREGLRRIRTDFVRTTRQVAEHLTSGSLPPFPRSEPTERPDRAATAISLGRVALLVDRSPFARVVPTTYFEFLKDSETARAGPDHGRVGPAAAPSGGGAARVGARVGRGAAVGQPGPAAGPLRSALAASLEPTRSGLPYRVLSEMLRIMRVVDIFTRATTEAPGGVGDARTIVGPRIIGQVCMHGRPAHWS